MGLGYSAYLSPGSNVYLVVDMAYGCAYEVLAPVTQRSVPLLEEHQRNQLKTVKVISNIGNGSASN